jgi:hypothetical protein
MNDFRNIQVRIAAINAQPSREEFNEEGFVLLRQSQGEAKALLNQPFEQSARGRGTEEHHKVQLKRYGMSLDIDIAHEFAADSASTGSSSMLPFADIAHKKLSSELQLPFAG